MQDVTEMEAVIENVELDYAVVEGFVDENTTHQVLWKMRTGKSKYQSVLQAIIKMLSRRIETSRVRIVK